MGASGGRELHLAGDRVRQMSRWGHKPRRWHKQTPMGRFRWYVETRSYLFAIDFRPWRGHQVYARYSRLASGGWSAVPDWTREDTNVKRRVPKAAGERPRALASLQAGKLLGLEPVIEQLAVITYEDGGARQNGLAIILVQGSEWQFLVKDPDSGTQFRARGATLWEAMEGAALALSCDEAPWEEDPKAKKPGGKKT